MYNRLFGGENDEMYWILFNSNRIQNRRNKRRIWTSNSIWTVHRTFFIDGHSKNCPNGVVTPFRQLYDFSESYNCLYGS